MNTLAKHFEDFYKNWQLKECDPIKIVHEDDKRLVNEKEGRIEMSIPPQKNVLFDDPPNETCQNRNTKYLWIIDKSNFPAILEKCEFGANLHAKRVCHSNLTGGALAYCGGEVWFTSSSKFFFNGGSGRYPVESLDQLNHIEKCFNDAGYEAKHMGWDFEENKPVRFWRGKC